MRRFSAMGLTEAEVAETAVMLPALLRAMVGASPASPQVLHRHALGDRHLRVLIALTAGPLSVSEVGERLRVTRSSASQLVGELSRAGLVTRTEDERDHRRTIVALAAQHRDEMTRFFDERLAHLRSALTTLTAEERTAFLKGLRATVAALEAARRPRDADEPDTAAR
jgi:DNA-binding MarR family transcriptional regulator